jgi:purine-nucleoside phosphorylase
MSQAYDPTLCDLARRVADKGDIPLREGVYACLSGPSFETPAEVHFLRTIGADAVGMSTAHEVTVARHMGLRVLGVSGITNIHAAGPDQRRETTHQEVLEAGRIISPRMISLLGGLLREL